MVVITIVCSKIMAMGTKITVRSKLNLPPKSAVMHCACSVGFAKNVYPTRFPGTYKCVIMMFTQAINIGTFSCETQQFTISICDTHEMLKLTKKPEVAKMTRNRQALLLLLTGLLSIGCSSKLQYNDNH